MIYFTNKYILTPFSITGKFNTLLIIFSTFSKSETVAFSMSCLSKSDKFFETSQALDDVTFTYKNSSMHNRKYLKNTFMDDLYRINVFSKM